MRKDGLRDLGRHDPSQLFSTRPPQVCDASEFPQQLLNRPWPDTWNVAKGRFRLPFAAALAVKADREAMRFVANLLDEVQHRRVALQNAGFVFLPQNVQNLFLLRYAGHRLIDDLQGFQSLRRGVQLADATVNQNQARHRPLLFQDATIAPAHGFAHACEIVVLADYPKSVTRRPIALLATNNELAIIRFLHPAVFPDNHRSHRIRALNMRNVKAFDAARGLQQIQGVLDRFADGLGRGLQDAEALLEGVLGIVFHEVQERALAAALWSKNFNFMFRAIGERLFQQGAVFEIDRDVNRFGQIFRFQVKLLQQGRHKFVRVKFFKVLPVKFAAIHHAAATQVKQVRGHQRRLGIIRKDVGIVALRGGDALALLDVFQRAQQIAIGGGLLEKLLFRVGSQAFLETLHQIVAAPLE